MEYLLFTLLFLYFTNWVAVKSLLVKLLMQQLVEPLPDSRVHTLLQKHFKLRFTVYLVHSDVIFGMATGIPVKAYIYLSEGVFNYLNIAEREWIVLHEGAHVKLWHPVIIAVVELVTLIFGIISLYYFNSKNILVIALLAVILSILQYQLNRILVELKADEFAVKHMKNPMGMITANKIMKRRGTSIFYKKPLLTYLFTPHPTYDDRMRMAKEEIIRRNV